MHIIFSEKQDTSTNNLIDWLICLKKSYLRYNGCSQNIREFSFKDADINLEFGNDSEIGGINSKNIELNERNIESLYYRRPSKNVSEFYNDIVHDDKDFEKYINSKQKMIASIEKNLLVYFLSKRTKKKLGSYEQTGLNKPIVLMLAKKNGLLVPNTLIVNSLKVVEDFFYRNNGKIINKSLEEVFYFKKEGHYYSTKTFLIDNIDLIADLEFSTSFFQEYIEKDYEVRVFYLAGKLYSTAIFSQLNSKTKVDFRNYDHENPNKVVPYDLPVGVKNSLCELMIDLGLDIGSIDILVKDGMHYFLEINPVGQYGFLSFNCNHNLDLEIAKYLINENL